MNSNQYGFKHTFLMCCKSKAAFKFVSNPNKGRSCRCNLTFVMKDFQLSIAIDLQY